MKSRARRVGDRARARLPTAPELDLLSVRDIIDYVCSAAIHQPIFFLWRPFLRDPADDMVAEVGFAAGAEAIVTHNRRDFVGVESLGMAVLSPNELLQKARP